MTLASKVGLDVAHTAFGQTGKFCYVLVERFDRQISADGTIYRFHQQDLCQAFGMPTIKKYQSTGGPTIQKCYDLIKTQCSREEEALKFLRAVAFNQMIGNCDAHAKNYSLVTVGNSYRLAPLYDLLSTAVYPRLSSQMSMFVGDVQRFDRVTRVNWLQLAETLEIPDDVMLDLVGSLAASLLVLAPALYADVKAHGLTTEIPLRITQIIETQAAHFLNS
jgi:serine/threonine-protein kinase HipA